MGNANASFKGSGYSPQQTGPNRPLRSATCWVWPESSVSAKGQEEDCGRFKTKIGLAIVSRASRYTR